MTGNAAKIDVDLNNALHVARGALDIANEARDEVTQVRATMDQVLNSGKRRDEQLTEIQANLTRGDERFSRMEEEVTRTRETLDKHKLAIEEVLIKPLGELPALVDDMSRVWAVMKRLATWVKRAAAGLTIILSAVAAILAAWEYIFKGAV